MQAIVHLYRTFKSFNPLLHFDDAGGHAYVDSKGESTEYAKKYAQENPEELQARGEILELTSAKLEELKKNVELETVVEIQKIMGQVAFRSSLNWKGLQKVDSTNGANGIIAFVEKFCPNLFKNPTDSKSARQLVYKWLYFSTEGKCNNLKSGDEVSLVGGRVTVVRDGSVQWTSELLPWSEIMFSEEKPNTTPPPTPEEAPAETLSRNEILASAREALRKSAVDHLRNRSLKGIQVTVSDAGGAKARLQLTDAEGKVKEVMVYPDVPGDDHQFPKDFSYEAPETVFIINGQAVSDGLKGAIDQLYPPMTVNAPSGSVNAQTVRPREQAKESYLEGMKTNWDQIMVSLQAQLPEGVAMKVEETGFKNKLSRRIVLSKDDKEAVVSVIVRQDIAPADRKGVVYDRNPEVEIRTGGKNYETVLEAVQAAQSKLLKLPSASSERINVPREKRFDSEIALNRELMAMQVEKYNRNHPKKPIDARLITYPNRTDGTFDLKFISDEGYELVVRTIPGEKYEKGAFEAKTGAQILFDGKVFPTVDDAVAEVFERLKDGSLSLQRAQARLAESLAPTIGLLQAKYRTEPQPESKGYGSDLTVSSTSNGADITYDILLKGKRYAVEVKAPARIDSDFDYTAEKGATIRGSNGKTYETVADAIKDIVDTETVASSK